MTGMTGLLFTCTGKPLSADSSLGGQNGRVDCPADPLLDAVAGGVHLVSVRRADNHDVDVGGAGPGTPSDRAAKRSVKEGLHAFDA